MRAHRDTVACTAQCVGGKHFCGAYLFRAYNVEYTSPIRLEAANGPRGIALELTVSIFLSELGQWLDNKTILSVELVAKPAEVDDEAERECGAKKLEEDFLDFEQRPRHLPHSLAARISSILVIFLFGWIARSHRCASAPLR